MVIVGSSFWYGPRQPKILRKLSEARSGPQLSSHHDHESQRDSGFHPPNPRHHGPPKNGVRVAQFHNRTSQKFSKNNLGKCRKDTHVPSSITLCTGSRHVLLFWRRNHEDIGKQLRGKTRLLAHPRFKDWSRLFGTRPVVEVIPPPCFACKF